MKKQSKHHIHSLTVRITAIAIIPLCILACILTIIGIGSIRSGIQDEVELTLQASTVGVQGMLDALNDSPLTLDGEKLYKGEQQITEQMLENMVKGTDLDVTIFYDKTRRATTLKDAKNGQFVLGTDAAQEVYDRVVLQGKTFTSYDMVINDEAYYVYYMPLKDQGGSTIGMLFAGAPASDVNSFIAVKTGTLVGVAIVIGILAFIVIIIRVLAIRNGLNDANGALGQLACGNLNVQMSKRLLKRKDELGSMAKSLQLLQNELRNIIEKIQSASNDVLTAGVQLGDMSAQTSENASEIGNAVDDIASGAVAQAEEIETATLRMNTLGELIDEMTENVKQLAVTSDKMDQSRERAEKIITELSESNVDTVDAASRMNRQIHITNDAAVRIQKAIQIITSIADETNLLSLNASIEAARAGEQGKGFAVVANQIQTLAEQSGESAKEIEEITAELLQESTQAVSIMEEMQNIVGEEAEKLEETKQQFMNVSDGVTETRNETQNMRQKTKECAGVRQEMMDVISNLSAVSEENAASTQETTASMQVLNDTIATQADSAGNLSNLSKSMDQQLKFFEL